MSDDVFIDVVGLVKNFGRTKAVNELTFQIWRGENICIIGPNSAGKTTLLLLLGGAHFPSKGHVTIDGKHRWRDNFAIRKQTTLLLAEPIVGACPTPYEFLRLYAQLYKVERSVFLERVRSMCQEMNLLPHVDKPWVELSLGMRKKVGLVSAFLPDVNLRILDEPFAGGIDPRGMETLYSWMDAAKQRGETILFSTQVLEQAEQIADRIMILDQGGIAAFESPADLIRNAGITDTYGRALHKAFMRYTKE